MAKPSKAELQVENWNLKHPVGTPVSLRSDGGEVQRTVTKSEAFVTFSGHPAIFLVNVGGYYLLDRVSPIVGETA